MTLKVDTATETV